jgi:hypothetical protein
MKSWPVERFAKLGIAVQFLALIRTLSEYFRLKHSYGPALSLATIDPYITGGLIAAACTAIAVGLYFSTRYRSAILVSVATVLALLIYKISVFGFTVR